VILPETSLETACDRAEELRQLVHDLHLEHQVQSLGGSTISLGVEVFPQHGEDPEAGHSSCRTPGNQVGRLTLERQVMERTFSTLPKARPGQTLTVVTGAKLGQIAKVKGVTP
jgi:hypothetical protein